MIPNYYLILGVPKTATKDEIKKAYRKLALQFHPDKNKAYNSHEQFVQINEANLILSDDEARKKYNHEYEFYFEQSFQNDKSNTSQSKEDSKYRQPNAGENINQQPKENITVSGFADEELNRWAKNARQQSENFAKMAFDEFSKLILGVVKETGFQIRNSLIMALASILTISGCGNLFIGLATKGKIGNPYLGIIFLPIGFLLWNFAQKSWNNHKV